MKIRNHPFTRDVGSFKKYVCLKLPVFEPPSPLFVPVCFVCTPNPPLLVHFSLLFKDPPPSRQTYFLNEPCVFFYNTWFVYNVDFLQFYKPPPSIFQSIWESSYSLEKMKDVPENDSNFLQYKMLIHISKSFYGIQECKQSMFYKCKTCLGYLTK